MEVVRVPDESAQDSVTSRLVEAELQVLSAEVQIGLGTRETEEQVPLREVCQLVPCTCKRRKGYWKKKPFWDILMWKMEKTKILF